MGKTLLRMYGLLLFCVLMTLQTNAQWGFSLSQKQGKPDSTSGNFIPPNSRKIQYTGRIQWLNDSVPRFWAPGVYFKMRFRGSCCKVFLQDEVLYGTTHNYVEVKVDDLAPQRIKTRWKNEELEISGLPQGIHALTICKDSESGIGYLECNGLECKELLIPLESPSRKIECIGNSITCGNGMDLSEIPCGKGQWYDQQNAFMSYGAVTARSLGAQWVLSSVSGIGMIHSCCQMQITMGEVFDKTCMRNDSLKWDFSRYTPDLVTICLGQNDGIQDSVAFCSAYIKFIWKVRKVYPNAIIICLNSPMADPSLDFVLKKYLNAIVASARKGGDAKVYRFFFSRSFQTGCGGHPDLAEHQVIAKELTAYIRRVTHW